MKGATRDGIGEMAELYAVLLRARRGARVAAIEECAKVAQEEGATRVAWLIRDLKRKP